MPKISELWAEDYMDYLILDCRYCGKQIACFLRSDFPGIRHAPEIWHSECEPAALQSRLVLTIKKDQSPKSLLQNV